MNGFRALHWYNKGIFKWGPIGLVLKSKINLLKHQKFVHLNPIPLARLPKWHPPTQKLGHVWDQLTFIFYDFEQLLFYEPIFFTRVKFKNCYKCKNFN